MPTTSNFGWTTPADTDLVKDGASAIRTLGNGIDTSMAQLKGGTTGQVLSKTSNTDMAFTWIANDQGDITAVTAGTGLTGGGTTGAVTLTNDMATAIDAKGDLIGGTGADTYARLAVGTNGQVLTADSTATTGFKWATPVTGGRTQLATGTLSGASITVSSIPGTYQDLYLIFTNVNPASDNTFLQVTINGETSNYGSPTAAFKLSAQTFGSANWTWDAGTDDTVVTNLYTATIPNYAGNTWKMFLGDAVTVNATTTTQYNYSKQMGLHSTTSAITSLGFQMSSGNFDGGTYFVYGVK